MHQVKAKKYLGQHFLKDMGVAQRIAESLTLDGPTAVLEIGPGMGVLTQFLLQNPLIDLTAVELDGESVVYLHEHYPDLKVIEADFLKMDLKSHFSDKFCVIGNFPYNISSQIFFKMLDNKDSIPCLAGMIQKEVAERIAAPAGSKTYGILSVLMQAYYKIEYLFTVGAHVFDPPPKVQSAVIRFTRNEVSQIDCNEQLFKTVVKTAFNQRRKTLRNSLKPIVESGHPMYADPIFDLRPERLDVAAFIDLTKRVEQALK
ncbi:MAG: 16S rRNA (adenine(1518)-N(6)/adenine(1519)-N(6))-dimethyltransferase RsmA [Paludibacter sp.]|nr:16S rRNA (adenine(1518)-N(6)/adenine(1519)-N(6))-dimethyltransferase RsmA [Paludibacter sp.]MBP7612092.1 16S rRNA (adenine(1518)-N(6)/adenine(1519)-N(6))-dimethyltransferase RsmA [Paludibacter sp.]